MAHDILKTALTLIILALIVAVVALFVSNYLSAFKPGDQGMKAPTYAVSGGRSAHVAVPSPSPTANPAMPGMPPGYPPAMMPGAAEFAGGPPMPMGPPPGWEGPPVAMAPERPAFEMPGVPSVPSVPGLDSIIAILFRWLPLIFSHDFDLSPVWPHLTR